MTPAARNRRDLTQTLREIAWAIHRCAPDRAGVGPIPTTELALLKQVIATPGATVGRLAQQLGLRQSNASAAIGVLVARGLVNKELNSSDRRTVRVVPTELGLSEHLEIAAAWTRPVEDAIASLSPMHQRAIDDAAEALDALHAKLTRDQ